jgi:4-hydroxy-tetrahydrodipicolinate synthase
MIKGCHTAIITPFTDDDVDYIGLEKLTDFQRKNGINGIVAAGTTGESPTLAWYEHNKVIETTAKKTKGNCICIAGTGSNNTKEAIEGTKFAVDAGVDAVLLVDPYYNGPSSLEIRREYIEPIATAFPEVQIIPYIIPGRTGTMMFPEDLAILADKFDNVRTVKEATGDLENMKKTRHCCGNDYSILSGDDSMIFKMMTDPEVKAAGLISVTSNIAPKAMAEMVYYLGEGNIAEAEKLHTALKPLFGLVTVITNETTPYGKIECRARNPLAAKTLMAILGMPSGKCRSPMGKMTKNGIEKVLEIANTVQTNNPEVFRPLAEFFNVDIDARLNDPENLDGLYYKDY